jgi:hypothetical protein
MPEKKTITRARRKESAGNAPSTQAGEFVREEIELIRKGAHGARSAKQAIAIGLSKARRAGVKLPPKRGSVSEETRKKAARDTEKAEQEKGAPTSRKRSQATLKALRREGTASVSKESLARQTKSAAKRRSPAERSEAAKKAVRTRRRK